MNEDFIGILIQKVLKNAVKVKDDTEREKYKNIVEYSIEILDNFSGLWRTLYLLAKSQSEGSKEEKFEAYKYHLGNFYLRSYLFKERLSQLINISFLFLSETNPTIYREIRENKRFAFLHDILKEFDNNPEIKEVFKIRRLFTHQKYNLLPMNQEALQNLFSSEDKVIEDDFYREFTKSTSSRLEKVVDAFGSIADAVCIEITKRI